MYRMLYRVGLLLGGLILALFIGANLINSLDPYRTLTEDLVHQLEADPHLTVRLNEYGTMAVQLRSTLHSEEAAAMAAWMDRTDATSLLSLLPLRPDVKLVTGAFDLALHKIADFDKDLNELSVAETLSGDLARLHHYDLNRGDKHLANLYEQSTAVSRSLSGISEDLQVVAQAVSSVTSHPAVETVQQEMADARNAAAKVVGDENSSWGFIASGNMASNFVQTADFIVQSIESWQGLPANLAQTRQKIDADLLWLNQFNQQYRAARVINDRWHFDTLRAVPRLTAEFHRPLLVWLIGVLLLAITGWVGSVTEGALVPRRGGSGRPIAPVCQAPVRQLTVPSLAFQWSDGRRERQILPPAGEVTIGNIVIRRARVRYYLERLDNAFPVRLNGQSVGSAHALQDGDILQIGELQTVFQIAG